VTSPRLSSNSHNRGFLKDLPSLWPKPEHRPTYNRPYLTQDQTKTLEKHFKLKNKIESHDHLAQMAREAFASRQAVKAFYYWENKTKQEKKEDKKEDKKEGKKEDKKADKEDAAKQQKKVVKEAVQKKKEK